MIAPLNAFVEAIENPNKHLNPKVKNATRES
jgi:hypothetical protein